jgi:membrane associated rhomboid family serine protease
MNEKIKDYNFKLKKQEIKKIFNTPEYQEYHEKKKKIQKRKENIYKFTSIGNSTNAIKTLIILNVIFFILSMFVPIMLKYFAIYNITNSNFQFWQPLTSMFLHSGFLHILFNMIVLWSLGNQLDQLIGSKKFLQLYFISGILSGISCMFLGTGPAVVGASGALCGILASYIFIAPDATILLFFFIPMKIKNLVYGFIIFSLVFGTLSLINPVYGFGIAHFAHLGGLISGYFITYYWKKRNLIPSF